MSINANRIDPSVVRTHEFLALGIGSALAATFLALVWIPTGLTNGLAAVVTGLMAADITLLMTPPLIRKMHAGRMVGQDVNKQTKTPVAELGGIAALFAFSVSVSLVVGLQKLVGNVPEPPFLAAISVFFMASMIGLIDDISDLRQRFKAVAVAFAALPLMLVHFGAPVVDFPFGYQLDLSGSIHLLYWLILVPLGVTGVANAMNMSAGYNGLETGQIATISGSMLIISELRASPDVVLLVFGALVGTALGLYYFNRFPARIFVGDIGTLGFGAVLAAGIILGHVEFYGMIAIAPAFYEGAATAYYGVRHRNTERKRACQNPIIQPDGTMCPPKGAEHYTLAFWILSKRPMTEKSLVRTLLALYILSGILAIALSLT